MPMRSLRSFRSGDAVTLSRRELLASLAGLFVARGATAQPGPPAIPVRGLNHLHLTVSDLQRSLEFYQRVFGMPLAGMQGVEADLHSFPTRRSSDLKSVV